MLVSHSSWSYTISFVGESLRLDLVDFAPVLGWTAELSNDIAPLTAEFYLSILWPSSSEFSSLLTALVLGFLVLETFAIGTSEIAE